tara:strand:- start:122 stop:349 length:228 start_codon:yes stop_codon:yes gene_type:complete
LIASSFNILKHKNKNIKIENIMKVHGLEFEKFYRVEDPWKVLKKNVRNYVLKKTFKEHLKSVDKIIEIGCGEGNY